MSCETKKNIGNIQFIYFGVNRNYILLHQVKHLWVSMHNYALRHFLSHPVVSLAIWPPKTIAIEKAFRVLELRKTDSVPCRDIFEYIIQSIDNIPLKTFAKTRCLCKGKHPWRPSVSKKLLENVCGCYIRIYKESKLRVTIFTPACFEEFSEFVENDSLQRAVLNLSPHF